MHAFVRSTAFLAFGTASLAATGCPTTEIVRNEDHCANRGGNAHCEAFDSRFPYCGRGSCFPEDRDGCLAERPEDACYSPCGGGISLADDPDQTCAGIDTLASTDGSTTGPGTTDGPSTSDGVTTQGASTETSESTAPGGESETGGTETDSDGETGTTTGPIPCLDTACIDPRFPFCDPDTQRCAPCSTADDPNAACTALGDGDRPFCADDVCVECLDADGCLDEAAPVCDGNTCVPCSAADLGVCAGTDTPVCFDNTCVPCSDDDPGICAETDQVCFDGGCVDCVSDADCGGNTPVCEQGTHTCVACTAEDIGSCDGNTPICDVAAFECVPCTSHEQCDALTAAAGPACNFETGACLGGVAVHVDGDAGCSDEGDAGSEARPFCTLTAALQAVPAEATIILHALDGLARYTESVTIQGDRRVAIIAATGATPRLQGTNTGPTFTVRNGAYLALEGLWLAEGLQTGIAIEQSTVYVDRVTITNHQQEGIRIDGDQSSLVIRSSNINTNGNHELVLNAGSTEITISFIAHTNVSQHSINVGASASLRMNYTSVSAWRGFSAAVNCNGPREDRSITIRNSVVVSHSPVSPDAIVCEDAQVSRSVLTGEFEGAVDSVTVDTGQLTFVDNNNLHLLYGGEDFRDVARWQPGDPTTDIDGDPRPTTPGSPDYAGADVPAP